MKYPGVESSTLEFKEKIPNKNQIVKTIVGFCNRFGGKLLIGVKDNGEIAGVPEEGISELIDSLHESIFKSCTPTILPTLYSQRFGEKLVLVIEVSPGMNQPYFLSAEGLMKGTSIRLGSITVSATPEMIDQLKWQSKGFSADEKPIYNATLTDINEQQFFEFLKARRLVYRTEETKNLISHYKLVMSEHGRTYPTRGGILLFGYEPQQYLAEAFIICSHFKGISGRNVIATRDCIGNLFQQAEDSIAFVLSRLNRVFEIKKTKRSEHLEVPEIAIREMIINAIVHRDYNLEGPVKIAIYDDRIEIFSPGNFPGPLNVDQLEMGITYIRNTILSKIFREAGFIEKLGSGFLTLFDSYRQYHLPRPLVIESSGFVKCILPRPQQSPPHIAEEDQKSKILRLFYVADQITTQDVMKQCVVSRQTAARLLSPLLKEGILKRKGKGPGTYYVRDRL